MNPIRNSFYSQFLDSGVDEPTAALAADILTGLDLERRPRTCQEQAVIDVAWQQLAIALARPQFRSDAECACYAHTPKAMFRYALGVGRWTPRA